MIDSDVLTNGDHPDTGRAFLPSFELVKTGLGIGAQDLARSRVEVSGDFLRFLLAELAKSMPFDPMWYAETYPDVEMARIAGQIEGSLHDHFAQNGWFEGRLPHAAGLDADWYLNHYEDLASAGAAGAELDAEEHFVGSGFSEGRAPNADGLADAERWLAAAHQAAAGRGAR